MLLAAMLLIDIPLSLLDLIMGIERVLMGFDSFQEWRRSAGDARIRRALARTKTA
jgi:hypothetical protein